MMKNTICLNGRTYDATVIIKERFGVGDSIIWNWAKRGLLPRPTKIGNRNFYDRVLVDELLSKGESRDDDQDESINLDADLVQAVFREIPDRRVE
jgi:hypothetical protein